MHEFDFRMIDRPGRVDAFRDLIEEVARGGSDFAITKDGKPVAVVVEYDAYLAMCEAMRERDDHD